jgi:hypothetical protein
MKLLIGGKSRNIYMRKDGSAYYKSGGQQVDVTYMFKKKGGGLKKKYIKGGTTEAKFTELKEQCNTLHDKLKELQGKLAPHTFTDSGNPTTQAFITNDIIKDNFNGGQLLTKLADEIDAASSSYTDDGVPEYDDLMKLLKQAEVSKGIKSLLSAGGDGTIQKDLEDIAVATAANFNTKQTALLARLNFFENVITEINKIGETTGEDGDANTSSTNDVDISTTLSVDVLLNFPSELKDFNRAFFTLAHLVISVINKINANNEHSLTITSTDSGKIIDMVQKLNALINLFSHSNRANFKGNEGVFYSTNKFRNEVINKADKFKTEYLEIIRAGTDKPTTYFIQEGKQAITADIICSIFKTFGSICKAGDTPATAPLPRDPISKTAIATNIHIFLNKKEVLAEGIKIPPPI